MFHDNQTFATPTNSLHTHSYITRDMSMTSFPKKISNNYLLYTSSLVFATHYKSIRTMPVLDSLYSERISAVNLFLLMNT